MFLVCANFLFVAIHQIKQNACTSKAPLSLNNLLRYHIFFPTMHASYIDQPLKYLHIKLLCLSLLLSIYIRTILTMHSISVMFLSLFFSTIHMATMSE